MKSLPLLFLGIFFALAFSWTGIVLSSHLQLGDLQPATPTLTDAAGEAIVGPTYVDEATGLALPGLNQADADANPVFYSGQAERGRRVYESMGCLYCHSQQVRPEGFGSDIARGWGTRQSVARDYILQERVMLGTMRTGPDLANVGLRYSELWQFQHLYDPRITSPGSIMPPFRFLFETRRIDEERGRSPEAIEIPADYLPGADYEVVPTQRARDLVAYLLNLQQDYDLPEYKRAE